MTSVFGLIAQESPVMEENQEELARALSEEWEEELSQEELAYQRESRGEDNCSPRHQDKCKTDCSKSNCKKGQRKGAAKRVVEGD